MAQGHHYIKRHKHSPRNAFFTSFDKFMYIVAFIAPVMTIPQFLDVWVHHQTQGVSLATWSAYALGSALWLVYGALHKDKILVLGNILIVGLDAAIVVGVLTIH